MSQELEDRFYKFAEGARDLCRQVKWDIINNEYIKQLIRASGAVGANYVEASHSLGIADDKMKLKIACREAKESMHWLKLILLYDLQHLEKHRVALIDKAEQIKKILSTIIKRLE